MAIFSLQTLLFDDRLETGTIYLEYLIFVVHISFDFRELLFLPIEFPMR